MTFPFILKIVTFYLLLYLHIENILQKGASIEEKALVSCLLIQ